MQLYRRIIGCLIACLTPGRALAADPLPRSTLVIDQSDVRGPFYYEVFSGLRATVNASAGAPVTIYAESLDLSRFTGLVYEVFSGPRATVNASAGAPVTIHAESLDLSRFTGLVYEESLQRHFHAKYLDKPIGVVVAIGSASLDYVLSWRQAIWIIRLLVFCVLTCLASQVTLAAEAKRVLLIYGSIGYTESIAANIRTELEQRSPELLEIYLASFAAAKNEGAASRYADYIGTVFSDHKLDLVVTVGRPAMTFFQEYGRQLFPSARLLAIVDESRVPSNLQDNETAITSVFDLNRGIQNILQLLPETTNVSVVIGSSPLEQYWLSRARLALQPYAGRVSFRWLNEFSLEDILNHIAALPPRSAILFVGLVSDGTGATYPDNVVVSKLHAVAKAPIFTLDDSGFGQGIVGGPWPSMQEITRGYASVALRILDGEALGGLKLPGIVSGTPKYDWRQMQRWGVSESSLPAGSEIQFRNPTAWDQYRWRIVSIAIVLLLQAALIIGLLYEHRRRRNAEVEARRRMSELAHMNRRATVGELSASIAHELNQPLGAILNNTEAAELLLASPSPNLNEIKEILADIRRDDQRASEVIKRLRRLLTKAAFRAQDFDLNETVREVFEFLSVQASARNVTLSSTMAPRAMRVSGDRIQLQQVILNLVVNGMEAVTSVDNAQRKITTRTALTDGTAEVSIADCGPGIPPDKLAAVFEPFFTTKEHGMGMGLSIARTIVEAHGGRIWAESQAGGGAVFRLSLPLARAR